MRTVGEVYRVGEWVWNPTLKRRFGLEKCQRCPELANEVCYYCDRPFCRLHLHTRCPNVVFRLCGDVDPERFAGCIEWGEQHWMAVRVAAPPPEETSE